MSSDSDVQVASQCPTCSRQLIGDYDKGELICPVCGFVVADRFVDLGPEWKAIDPDDRARRVRTGSPMTLALHDLGLTTDIGPRDVDSKGKKIDPATRYAVESLRRWQTRIRTSTSEERGLSNMLVRISDLCNALNLPQSVLETAAKIYRIALKKHVAKSKSILGMTAASVYLACRQCNVDRGLKQIAKAAAVNFRIVAKYYRLLRQEVQTDYVAPLSVDRHISRLVNLSHYNPKIERLALTLHSKTSDSGSSGGKTPVGLAAAYIYISALMLGESMPQKEIADVAEVTEVTVRNRCKEILRNYMIRQYLKPYHIPA